MFLQRWRMRCWVAAGAAVLLGAGGCGRSESASGPRGEAVPWTVFYTCDTRGHLYPCDCEGGREGGVSRRLTYLRQHPERERILVDAGNVTAGRRAWELLELEYLLKAYGMMGYDAVNLGHGEAALPAERLRALGERYAFLVSANLVDERGEPVVTPYRVVRLPSGRRVGIIGVMDDRLPTAELGPGVSLLPPDTALGRYLPALQKEADEVVLLAFAGEGAMTELGNLFFELSVIVGGKVPQPSPEALVVNEAALVYITDQGKSVGRLRIGTSSQGRIVRSNSVTALTEDFADAPEMSPLLRDFERELKARRFLQRTDLRDDAEGLSAIDPGGADSRAQPTGVR